MRKFTFEEQCLISCFTGSSRAEILMDMEQKLPYLEEDIGSLTQKTIKKLKSMTNSEFEKAIV